MPETNQNPLSESKEKEQEGKSNTDTTSAPIQDKKQLDHRLEPSHNAPNFSNTPQPGQEPNLNQKNNKVQQTDQRLQTSRPYLKQISAGERVLKTEYNKTSKLQPPFRHMPSMRTSVRPGVKPIQRSKQAGRLQPSPQTKTDPPRISWAPSDNTLRSPIRDCSDHMLRGRSRSGVYMVTPDLRSSSFQVYCDMELDGGGWTLLQRRQDGRVSFNRTWVEYRAGFGVLDGGDFWLGNNKIHPLTRDRDMELRVELEDFQGVTGHAQYEYFRVASERLRYRLTVGGYSGTAGDALRFSKTYDHNNRAFTTPDRDNDRYPSGNCGAYYSSGWWFDACMAANLNGRYYTAGRYKGVRDGIFWGTWHNISSEYYPTNERQSFKSVRMMIRPKSFGSH
uniref:Fibrinogen like 2 n=1 Tax=Cyprinodon variegatus TaxID=28743 RepID=A0A3Q2DV65_CYPVA